MEKDEKILLTLMFTFLTGLIVFKLVPKAEAQNPVDELGVSNTPYNSSFSQGRAFQIYNQPWAFTPPVGNFLPSLVRTSPTPVSFPNQTQPFIATEI